MILLLLSALAFAAPTWRTKVSVNPMDNEKTCLAFLQSDKGSIGLSVTEGEPLFFSATVMRPNFLDRSIEGGVFVSTFRVKVGDADPITAVGSTTDDARLVIAPEPAKAILNAPGGTKVLVELDVWNRGQVIHEFTLPDPKAARETLAKCGMEAEGG